MGRRVITAGCEITPSWACGARLYVPFTQQQLSELEREGFDILDHHIVALDSDKELIEIALQDLPRKGRPRLSNESPLNAAQAQVNSEDTPSLVGHPRGHDPSVDQDLEEDEDGPMVVVEHAFPTNSSLGYPVYEETHITELR